MKERLAQQQVHRAEPHFSGNRISWNGREMIWNPAGSATAVTSGSAAAVNIGWNFTVNGR